MFYLLCESPAVSSALGFQWLSLIMACLKLCVFQKPFSIQLPCYSNLSVLTLVVAMPRRWLLPNHYLYWLNHLQSRESRLTPPYYQLFEPALFLHQGSLFFTFLPYWSTYFLPTPSCLSLPLLNMWLACRWLTNPNQSPFFSAPMWSRANPRTSSVL